ncbi:MAG TPA: metallophosphoesterase [Kofleriaceae bacterium]
MRRYWRRLAIVLAVLGSAHFYIWWRFVDAARLPSPWFGIATAAVAILTPCVPGAAILMRLLPRERALPIVKVAYVWFGTAVYLLPAAALSHVAVAFGADPRRAAAVAIAIAALTVIYGLVNARRGPIVRRVRVPLANLPAAADGYTIVQLTDVHIGPTLHEAFAANVVARVNALSPDLIVLTGDLIDGHVGDLARHVEPFRELRAADGVFAVTGNHEYYWDAEAWVTHFSSLGFRYLRNANVAIRDAFTLAGSDDNSAAEDIGRAVAGRDATLPCVLLAHHPSSLPRAQAAGVDLQLSGHTHGGQLLPLGWLARLFEPHVAGLARFGATWLYVSEGTGFWGPPMRVGTHCEIALITLTRTA